MVLASTTRGLLTMNTPWHAGSAHLGPRNVPVESQLAWGETCQTPGQMSVFHSPGMPLATFMVTSLDTAHKYHPLQTVLLDRSKGPSWAKMLIDFMVTGHQSLNAFSANGEVGRGLSAQPRNTVSYLNRDSRNAGNSGICKALEVLLKVKSKFRKKA